jgi:hypothetical protein
VSAIVSTLGAVFASHVGATYSFKALTGVLRNKVLGVTIPFTGKNLGLGGITIRMAVPRTVHETGVDGAVIPLYVAGDNGEVEIEVQQSSTLNSSLLSLYNRLLIAAQGGDYTGWASTSILFTFGPDGSQHYLTGLSFEKFPDKPYAAAGQRISWKMIAANINSVG